MVTVTHGPRVVLASFTVQGLPADVAAQVAAGWTHPTDAWYDGLSVNTFLKVARSKHPDVFAAYPSTTVTTTPTAPGRVAVVLTFARQ